MLMGLTELPPGGEEGMDAETVKGTVVVCFSAPEVPVMVSVTLPTGVVPVVVTLSDALPGRVMELGLKDNDVPAGNPVAAKFTAPANPFTAPPLTVYVAVPP